jgi:hypothetical protein
MNLGSEPIYANQDDERRLKIYRDLYAAKVGQKPARNLLETV